MEARTGRSVHEPAEPATEKAPTPRVPAATTVDMLRTPGLSNAAVAALIARQPTGTVDPAPAPAPVNVPGLMTALLPVFHRAAAGEADGFAEDLGAWTNWALTPQTDAQRAEIKRRADEIAALQELGPAQELYSIPEALHALEKLHAGAVGIDGMDASLGLQHLARLMARDSATYLAEALAAQAPGMPPPQELSQWHTAAVRSIHEGDALVMLELEGTVARLAELRAKFELAQDRDQRKAVGAEIGVAARRAVLLDDAARKARGPGAQPLMDTVERALGTIRAAERDAATESSALHALGNGLQLLGGRAIDLSASPAGDLPARQQLEPELAFPRATDAADERFMGDLAGRMESQAAEVDSLRKKVVPAGLEIRDFAAAHRRWWAFYSQQQEKLDPVGSLAWTLIEQLYDGPLGIDTGDPYISIQQGLGRALLMPQIAHGVGGGFARDFTGELRQAGPRRTERTTGDASSPDYDFAEMVGPGAGASHADERASRASLSQQRRTETSVAMNTVAMAPESYRAAVAHGAGMAPDASVPIRGEKVTTPQDGWSYLVDVHDKRVPAPDPPLALREHKVVPPEVVEYLVARQQQIATLQEGHTPKARGVAIGGPRISGTSGGALEHGTGMAAEVYVEGEQPVEGGRTRLDPTARRLQSAHAAGLLETGAEPTKGDPSARALSLLRNELEQYLDRWLVERREVEYRIAAVIAIAQTEHNIRGSFQQFLEAGEFAKMIAKAVGIASGLAVLSMLGPLGRLASAGIGAYLRSQGVSDVTALMSLGAFLKQASEASSFSSARGWALVARSAASDLASVLENLVTDPLTDGIARIGQSPPKTAQDVLDTIGPVLSADPKVKQEVLAEIDRRIAEFDAAHGTAISHPDRESLVALRDGLIGQTTPEGALGADIPSLRGDRTAPKGMELLTGPRKRNADEWKALRAAIGDPAVPVVENPDLGPTTVQVRYDESGVTMVEIGPDASPRHVEAHAQTVRELRAYEGVVGRIRLLASRLLSALRIAPGFGDKGFEAQAEVRKLRRIQESLRKRESALAERLQRLSDDPASAEKELAGIKRELADVEAQLKGWEAQVGSFEKGRGIVAAVDSSGSQAPREYAIQQVNPRRQRGQGWVGMPETVPPDTVLEFPGGERVWRTREGTIAIESRLGPGPGRAGYESKHHSRSAYADPGYQAALYELAHSQGQGTGFESPYAIKLAPNEVNQRLQRHGIEEYLYRLRDQHPDTDFHIVTNTAGKLGTRRLHSIEYTIYVTHEGRRQRLFEFEIVVEGTLGQPNVLLPPDSVWVNTDPRFERYVEDIDMADVHARFAAVDLAP